MAIAFKDYYTTLGVARDASDDVLKKAFRKLAREFHPDVAKDKTTAEAKFKEINEAYEVLSDAAKRKKYDQLGEHWQDEGAGHASRGWQQSAGQPGGEYDQEFHFGGTGYSDFFEQFFGGGSNRGMPRGARSATGRARRGSDVEGDILVTLEEAMQGTLRPISLQMRDQKTGQAQTHSFQVRVPAGVVDGKRIRVPGQGEPGQNGGEAGDLYLRVRHAAHPDFTARENDLYHELDIAPWEAVLGGEVVIKTLDGSIKLRIPAHAENGQHMRVRGRGLPKGKTGERGDLFVTLTVQVPDKTSEQERALWEQLRSVSTFNPRSTSQS